MICSVSRQLFAPAASALLLVALVATSAAAPSDFSTNNTEWHEGVVILVGDEVLSGEIHYNSLHQLVLLRSAEGHPISTFTARQVRRFFYYHPRNNIIHRFLAIERRSNLAYAVRRFYEVVAEGPVLYLRQPNRSLARPPNDSNPHTVAFQYFAYYQGKLVRAHAFEKQLLPTLVQEKPILDDYMKANQLQPYHVGDQILLVNYFNQRLAEPLANLTSPR